ncbi:substrate-binding periplasmic protein [Shewanella khirikhana]|uniref:Bacterial extracellular solute-binding protein, family 3 n=1 Tax=Shewanella khirikhana TaxID=1965282 RepID=A0ABM7D0C1_9GAMM|nr:transporter substrate-binding domain-containing protein [Shewanella khirikhana]AZQ09782.1 Bacterial extracellular solute-binding protein, family 3 [Shewanella khirikhana]
MILRASLVIVLFCAFGVCSAEMRACVDEFPPYQSLEPKPHGDNIIALMKLAELIDHQPVFVPSPNFARCLHMLDTGRVDIVAGIINSENRDQRWLLLPYRQDARYVFLYRPGTEPVRRYEDLRGHLIAVSRNTLYFERFDEDKQLQREVVSDLPTGVRMLLADRVGLVIAPENALPFLASQFSGFHEAVRVSEFGVQPERIIHFAVSRRHKLAISNNELATLADKAYHDGVFERAIFGEPIPLAPPNKQ